MKLVMLSGGLDSTVALYKLLTETNDPLHVHHIVIRNIEHRWEAELLAMQHIVPYLKKIRSFTYTENMWGFLQFKTHYAWDNDIVWFTAAQIAKNTKDIEALVLGKCKDDDEDGSFSGRAEQSQAIFQACFMHEDTPIPDVIRPVGEMNKAELAACIPKELYNMTWSCRTPERAPSGEIVRCEKCKTCKQFQSYKL